VFGLDTQTGDLVNKVAMDMASNFIALIGGTNKMVVAGAKLLITDAPLRPVILDVAVGKKKTVVSGANFLRGASLTINGADAAPVGRDPTDPASGIIIDSGRKDFPTGQPFTLVIINRDGTTSEPFTLTR
jgi:hypothetical protein